MNTLDVLIPAPQKVIKYSGTMPGNILKNFYLDKEFAALQIAAGELFAYFDLPAVQSTEKNAVWSLQKNPALPPESYTIEVQSSGMTLCAADMRGALYALNSCRQLFFAAFIRGAAVAEFNCGKIEDAPRFTFRSFHLDSARHFQQVKDIKRVLKLMSIFHLNTFHWHLVDSQGWRLQLKSTAGLENCYTLTPGFFTAADIKEVTDYARQLGIDVIPEVDIPGHAVGTLKFFPQYACCNAQGTPGEFCLGNPESKTFLKQMLTEVMELFPDSEYFHIGGDEAETVNWEQCPLCRKAMQEQNCSNIRQLENNFMIEMTRFVAEHGKKPVIWGTCSGQVYPADTTIQCWLDIREPLRVAPNGNKVIYSVHNSLYFDYPANLSEPWETWMFELSERGVYMTDPFIIWQEKVKDVILGVEACLWTEVVPRHRILQKILPRLFAYSECAWSQPGNKDYVSFCQRKELLESAGFNTFLTEF